MPAVEEKRLLADDSVAMPFNQGGVMLQQTVNLIPAQLTLEQQYALMVAHFCSILINFLYHQGVYVEDVRNDIDCDAFESLGRRYVHWYINHNSARVNSTADIKDLVWEGQKSMFLLLGSTEERANQVLQETDDALVDEMLRAVQQAKVEKYNPCISQCGRQGSEKYGGLCKACSRFDVCTMCHINRGGYKDGLCYQCWKPKPCVAEGCKNTGSKLDGYCSPCREKQFVNLPELTGENNKQIRQGKFVRQKYIDSLLKLLHKHGGNDLRVLNALQYIKVNVSAATWIEIGRQDGIIK